jgi:hypothetical protein
MKPEMEAVEGDRIPAFKTMVSKDITVGEDFRIFCNVTLDVGHHAKLKWLRNASILSDIICGI